MAAAALAETQEIEDHKSFLFINWGSGIGGAYARFLNGNWEVLPSELGHQILEVGGRECSCGQKGCLEAYCGGEFIKKYSGKMAKELDQESWGKVEEVFSVGLTNLIAILLPEKIIFQAE